MAVNYVETTANLNIRELGEVQETVSKGTILTVSDNIWREILFEDGSYGLASGKYFIPYTGDVEKEEVSVVLPVIGLTGKAVVAKAMTQAGDPYIFGYEVDLKDPNPKAFDCSELVQWVCAQLGASPIMPDGAANQYEHCKKYGTLITVAQATRTIGALLFRISSEGNHVVISRGDGSTIEAKGKAYGVGVFSIAGRGWTAAGLIPGIKY